MPRASVSFCSSVLISESISTSGELGEFSFSCSVFPCNSVSIISSRMLSSFNKASLLSLLYLYDLIARYIALASNSLPLALCKKSSSPGLVKNPNSTKTAGMVEPRSTARGCCFTPRFLLLTRFSN